MANIHRWPIYIIPYDRYSFVHKSYKDLNFTFVELGTNLTRTEASLNSLPLSQASKPMENIENHITILLSKVEN